MTLTICDHTCQSVASDITDSLDEHYCEELTKLGIAESLLGVNIGTLNKKYNGPATDDDD